MSTFYNAVQGRELGLKGYVLSASAVGIPGVLV